jgi:hypothetical protein
MHVEGKKEGKGSRGSYTGRKWQKIIAQIWPLQRSRPSKQETTL